MRVLGNLPAVNAGAKPVDPLVAGVVVFEAVPIHHRLIPSVDVEHPADVVGPFLSGDPDDVAIGFAKAGHGIGVAAAFLVPKPVPGEPEAVDLDAVFGDQRAPEAPRVAHPTVKIRVEAAAQDVLEVEERIGRGDGLVQQHEADVGDAAIRADPVGGGQGKAAALIPVITEVNPGGALADDPLIA